MRKGSKRYLGIALMPSYNERHGLFSASSRGLGKLKQLNAKGINGLGQVGKSGKPVFLGAQQADSIVVR